MEITAALFERYFKVKYLPLPFFFVLGVFSIQNTLASEFSESVSKGCGYEANKAYFVESFKLGDGKDSSAVKKQAYQNCIIDSKDNANSFKNLLIQTRAIVHSNYNGLSIAITKLDLSTRLRVRMKLDDLSQRIFDVSEGAEDPKLTNTLNAAKDATSDGDAYTLLKLISQAIAELETFKKEVK